MLFYELKVLLCVKRCRALDPGMNRIRADNVELLLCCDEVVASVIVNNLYARILQDVVILRTKILRHRFRYQTFQFANNDSFNAGIQDERAGCHTRPKPDDQHRTRAWMEKRG